MTLEGIEVFRTDSFALYEDRFRLAAKTVQLLGQLPVIQTEGKDTVLYAIRPGLFRKPKPRKGERHEKDD